MKRYRALAGALRRNAAAIDATLGDDSINWPSVLRWAADEAEALALEHEGAVEALQAIYDHHHMVGDGSAGKVSGDALRALGIDPDAGSNDHGV